MIYDGIGSCSLVLFDGGLTYVDNFHMKYNIFWNTMKIHNPFMNVAQILFFCNLSSLNADLPVTKFNA